MTKKITILDKAEAAMEKAVKKVIAEHKKSGRPLSIWKGGRVTKVAVK